MTWCCFNLWFGCSIVSCMPTRSMNTSFPFFSMLHNLTGGAVIIKDIQETGDGRWVVMTTVLGEHPLNYQGWDVTQDTTYLVNLSSGGNACSFFQWQRSHTFWRSWEVMIWQCGNFNMLSVLRKGVAKSVTAPKNIWFISTNFIRRKKSASLYPSTPLTPKPKVWNTTE